MQLDLTRSLVLPIAVLAAVCVVASPLARAARAEHDMTCHPPGGGHVGAVWLTVGFFEFVDESSGTSRSLLLRLGRGRARARGILRDGTSITRLAAERPARLECADADADGRPGLSALEVAMHARRSQVRAVLNVVILPASGEVDSTGRHHATALVTLGSEILQMDGTILARSVP